MNKVLTIIPARGGSTRIKNKNLKTFNNRPLIYWTIRAAQLSGFKKNIYVTSEDKNILRTASQFGVNIIKRPPELSDNVIMPDSAIKHALENINEDFEAVVYLQPTSPLRKIKDIKNAYRVFIEEKCDSLLSVCKQHAFIWEKINKKYYKPINYDYLNRPRSQDAWSYFENGSIYIFKPKVMHRNSVRFGGNISIYEMENWQSVDIDYQSDFNKAEKIFKEKLNYE